jgi:hypothetical protein
VVGSGSGIRNKLKGKIRIRFRIRVKGRIRIRINVMQIRNTDRTTDIQTDTPTHRADWPDIDVVLQICLLETDKHTGIQTQRKLATYGM